MPRLILLVAIIACVVLFSVPVFGQTDVEIPSWVKGVANFWVEDKINDGEFAEALEFLIDSNIIQLGNTVIVSEPQIDWKAEFDKQEKDWQDKFIRSDQEHSKVYLEMNQKYIDRDKLFDDNEKEWRTSYNKVSEENDKLKIQIKDLTK